MEELTPEEIEVKKRQEALLQKEEVFEKQQKALEEARPEWEKKEKRKDKIITWTTIGFVFLFILFLAYKLLFK